jgi:hypothetical protein
MGVDSLLSQLALCDWFETVMYKHFSIKPLVRDMFFPNAKRRVLNLQMAVQHQRPAYDHHSGFRYFHIFKNNWDSSGLDSNETN